MISLEKIEELINKINFNITHNKTTISIEGCYLGDFLSFYSDESPNDICLTFSYKTEIQEFRYSSVNINEDDVKFFLIQNIWRNYCINNSNDVIEFKSGSNVITSARKEVSHGKKMFKELQQTLKDNMSENRTNFLGIFTNALVQNNNQELCLCKLTNNWHKDLKLSIYPTSDFSNLKSAISAQLKGAPDCNFLLTLGSDKVDAIAGSKLIYISCNALFVTYNNNRVLDDETIKKIVSNKLDDNNLKIIVDSILGQEEEEKNDNIYSKLAKIQKEKEKKEK